MIRDKNTQSPVGRFAVKGKVYTHVIYCADDDRVECLDEDGKIIFTYTSKCDMLDSQGKIIGRWNTDNRYSWYLKLENGMRHTFGIDLLEAEMEASKMFLTGELK